MSIFWLNPDAEIKKRLSVGQNQAPCCRKRAKRYYCEHNKRLAVFQKGYWETVRDVLLEEVEEKV